MHAYIYIWMRKGYITHVSQRLSNLMHTECSLYMSLHFIVGLQIYMQWYIFKKSHCSKHPAVYFPTVGKWSNSGSIGGDFGSMMGKWGSVMG